MITLLSFTTVKMFDEHSDTKTKVSVVIKGIPTYLVSLSPFKPGPSEDYRRINHFDLDYNETSDSCVLKMPRVDRALLDRVNPEAINDDEITILDEDGDHWFSSNIDRGHQCCENFYVNSSFAMLNSDTHELYDEYLFRWILENYDDIYVRAFNLVPLTNEDNHTVVEFFIRVPDDNVEADEAEARTTKEIIFYRINVYNNHNGYYSHTVRFTIGDEYICTCV